MKKTGFTLVELMVAIAIISILMAVAMPSYRDYILKSRRTEATTQLTQLQLAEEKYRGNNQAYATLSQIGFAAPLSYYTLAVAPNGDDYTLTATAINQQASDTVCAMIAIAQTSSGTAYIPTDCWK